MVNKFSFFALLIIIPMVFSTHSQTWNLIWSEEFNTDGPVDTSQWHFETGTGSGGWGNNELQYYTSKPENAYIRSGNLEITVRRQDTVGKKFTSARMITMNKFSFQYGKVEARIKVLKGKGMWPAFWMMGESFSTVGWPGCGELDIMEVMNRGGPLDDNIVLSTAHWLYDANNTHASYGLSDTSATPLADSFHVYAITWDKRSIRS
jgi:beta-glucanase (GH16 family)